MDSLSQYRRARFAIAIGLVFPLVLPWGFVRTGTEIWTLAETSSPGESFLSLYVRVLVAFRWFLIAFAVASIGRLLVAWGAVRAFGGSARARAHDG